MMAGRSINWDMGVKRTAEINQRITANVGLVRKALVIYARRFPKADIWQLESDGMMALARCARSFNPHLGYTFSTYTYRSICRTMYIRGTRYKGCREVSAETMELKTVAKRVATPAAVDLVLCREASAERVGWVRRYLDRLTQQHRTVLESRFVDGMKFHEIAERIGVTKQRVQQIAKQAAQEMAAAWATESASEAA